MKKSAILSKIKGELLDKEESKQITGGYTGGCYHPRCNNHPYPPRGIWDNRCGYLYWDPAIYSYCKP
ncbi:hypothetical protein [Aquimarina rhabdastrellae]